MFVLILILLCPLDRYPYSNDQHVFWEILVKKHFPAVIRHAGLCDKLSSQVNGSTSLAVAAQVSSSLTFCNLDSCRFASCSLSSKEDYSKSFLDWFLFVSSHISSLSFYFLLVVCCILFLVSFFLSLASFSVKVSS
jgi:hypothetical protein